MVKTEYVLHPLGRKLMIGLLVLLFAGYFAIAQWWVAPLNLILSLFTSFQLRATFFVRGASGVLLSIATTALILEVTFEKVSWYRLQFDENYTLTLKYRSGLTQPYHTINFSLRETKIEYLDYLMWIVTTGRDSNFSILLRPPGEDSENPFYNIFDEAVDDHYYKVRKRLEGKSFHDIDNFYMFSSGSIKKFTAREFELLTGLDEFYRDVEVKEEVDKPVEYIEEEDTAFENQTDEVEFNQIMANAATVNRIK